MCKKKEPTSNTTWKVSKYGVISGQYFLAFELTTEYELEITSYLDNFHAL